MVSPLAPTVALCYILWLAFSLGLSELSCQPVPDTTRASLCPSDRSCLWPFLSLPFFPLVSPELGKALLPQHFLQGSVGLAGSCGYRGVWPVAENWPCWAGSRFSASSHPLVSSGMDVLNEAIENLTNSHGREQWTPSLISVSDSVMKVHQAEVTLLLIHLLGAQPWCTHSSYCSTPTKGFLKDLSALSMQAVLQAGSCTAGDGSS